MVARYIEKNVKARNRGSQGKILIPLNSFPFIIADLKPDGAVFVGSKNLAAIVPQSADYVLRRMSKMVTLTDGY